MGEADIIMPCLFIPHLEKYGGASTFFSKVALEPCFASSDNNLVPRGLHLLNTTKSTNIVVFDGSLYRL
jgi:hypothetical protein